MDKIQSQTLAAPQALQSSGIQAQKRSKAPSDSEFDGTLTQAGAALQALAGTKQTQAQQTPVQASPGQDAAAKQQVQAKQKPNSSAEQLAQMQAQQQKAAEAGSAQIAALDAGKRSALQTSAERSPVTDKPATSMNTGKAIAGLKPWSKDWVFTGTEDQNPDLQTLIKDKSPETAVQSKAAQILNQLRTSRGELEAETPKTKGEAAVAGNNPSAHGSMQAQEQPPTQSQGASNGQITDSQMAQLMGQLAALDGMVDDARTHEAPNAHGKQQLNGKMLPGYAGMSGGEFLQLKDGVRSPNTESGIIYRPQDVMGDQALGGQIRGLDGRPNLRVFEGGESGEKGTAESIFAGRTAQNPNPDFRTKLKPFSGRADDLVASSGMVLHPNSGGVTASLRGPMPEVTGHVVPGAMARDRLSSESLIGVSTEIRNIAPNGTGEMRLRLKPDNLGELHVRVMAQGNTVGLQIRASDERAKAIIEESISHLKESLATQNLTLGSVEVAVSHPGQSASGGNLNDQYQQQTSHQAFDGLMRQDAGQSGQGRNGWSGVDSDFNSRTAASAPRASAAMDNALAAGTSRSISTNGRLDLMA